MHPFIKPSIGNVIHRGLTVDTVKLTTQLVASASGKQSEMMTKHLKACSLLAQSIAIGGAESVNQPVQKACISTLSTQDMSDGSARKRDLQSYSRTGTRGVSPAYRVRTYYLFTIPWYLVK